MKTKTLLLLCLFLGIGLTQLFAQKTTVKYELTGDVPEPIMCDGEEYWLTGVLYGQEVDIYYKDGELKKGINHLRGELTNESTGEVFDVHIQYRGDWIDGFVIEQGNFKGNMGTRVNQRLVWDVLAGWLYYYTKTNCH